MPGHRKRRQFKQTDAFTRGMVIGLKRAGWSIRQIAADTHLGASTVHRLWRRWLEQGNVAIYRNSGATRVTSARVDRRILRQAVAAPQATCTAILQHMQDTLDHSISTRTISRRLVANGLHSCRPLRRLPLTPPNRRQRFEWCRARSTWMTEWHRVVFSDESRFCLFSDSRRVRVWRRRGERSNPAAIVERPTLRQRGIMVWGAIAYDSRSPLLRIQGTMTVQRYVDDVLRPVTLPYLQGVPNALYQQDNARPHTARISQQALQDVQMLPWPPYSPDLSPIEHVWDIIGRRLHALPQLRSEDELWQMVEKEWRAIPQDAIRTLIDSLPRRVAACISVRADAHPSTFFSGGTLTAQRYRDEILEPYLRPHRDQIGHNFILMDDNARPHRARLVNEYFQSENVRRMDWPARSPDLNPIEHVWNALGRRIGARHPSPEPSLS
ncbi:Transposase [Cordylochernes scorpioides]|uniref:Transposase n=1 Tax=Cordylochernes scorpioides TaxID=51811 RepID=A0ABY6LRN4_9ARAC|nr:Transposase [Cordylochernes scorpioides]